MVEAVVEFEYKASESDELSLRVGDVVRDVRPMEGGWWEGCVDGKRGLFPDNFVKVLKRDDSLPPIKTSGQGVSLINSSSATPSNSSAVVNDENIRLSEAQSQSRLKSSNNKGRGNKQCRVLFSYAPVHEDELELKLNDVIDVEGEVEDGWWQGTLNGRSGVFPSNFVELIINPVRIPGQEITKAVENRNIRNQDGSKTVGDHDVVTDGDNRLISTESSVEKKADDGVKPLSVGGVIKKLNAAAAAASVQPVIKNESRNRTSPVGCEADDSSRGLKNQESSQHNNASTNAPKLPPKPVRDQCVVMFPYDSVNDDELSLKEGQIVTILSKEVEDKGWWKGELDGKVGVFPDNFVKIISTASNVNPATSVEELSKRRGSRSNTTTTISQSKSPPPSASKAQLSQSSEELTSSLAVAQNKGAESKPQVSQSPSSSDPKKPRHSFGKLHKPRPPPPQPSSSFKNATKKPAESKEEEEAKKMKKSEIKMSKEERKSLPITPCDKDLEDFWNTNDELRGPRLSHPTMGRAKMPSRRPPSTSFLKGLAMKTDEDTDAHKRNKKAEIPKETNLKNNNVVDVVDKGRLSLKKIQKQVKEVIGGLTNGNVTTETEQVSSMSNSSKLMSSSETKLDGEILSNKSSNSLPRKPPPPKPPLPKADVAKESKKSRPEWLEELSRKQANRRSGLFKNENAETSTTTDVGAGSNNNLGSDNAKPQLPAKPTQLLHDDGRRSMTPSSTTASSVITKRRPSSMEELESSSSKPVVDTSKPELLNATTKPKSASKSSLSKDRNGFHDEDKVTKEERRHSVESHCHLNSNIDQKPDLVAVLDKVRVLESALNTVQLDFGLKLDALRAELDSEREARIDLERQLHQLRRDAVINS